jgi:hypothetical protein
MVVRIGTPLRRRRSRQRRDSDWSLGELERTGAGAGSPRSGSSDELGEAVAATVQLSRVLGQLPRGCPSLLEEPANEDEPPDVKEQACDLLIRGSSSGQCRAAPLPRPLMRSLRLRIHGVIPSSVAKKRVNLT